MKARALIFVALGALVLGGLFVAMKPAQTVSAPAPVASNAPASATVAVAPAATTHRFEFVIQNGKKTAGPDVMQVTQGDEVTLLLASDHADEAHLHGYDLEANLQPKNAAALTFKAERSGRFTLELHHSHVELGALEVQPR